MYQKQWKKRKWLLINHNWELQNYLPAPVFFVGIEWKPNSNYWQIVNQATGTDIFRSGFGKRTCGGMIGRERETRGWIKSEDSTRRWRLTFYESVYIQYIRMNVWLYMYPKAGRMNNGTERRERGGDDVWVWIYVLRCVLFCSVWEFWVVVWSSNPLWSYRVGVEYTCIFGRGNLGKTKILKWLKGPE